MTYKDFKVAAEKHLISCYCMIDYCDTAKKVEDKNKLKWTIYYLRGYVIECSFKYAFCSGVGFHKLHDIKNIETFTYRTKSISYDKLASHNLDALRHYIETFSKDFLHGIPIITEIVKDTRLKKLYSNWDIQIRYSKSYAKAINEEDLDIEILRKYLDEVVKPIFYKLQNR